MIFLSDCYVQGSMVLYGVFCYNGQVLLYIILKIYVYKILLFFAEETIPVTCKVWPTINVTVGENLA